MTLCLAADRCRGFDHTTQTPALTERPLCDLDLSASTHDIPLLVHDYRDLEQLLPKSISEWGDGQPGHSGEPPIPFRLGVEALQREIWWLATAWAEVLGDVQQLAPAPHRRPSPLVRFFAASADGKIASLYRPSRVEHPSAQNRPMRPGPVDVVRAVGILGPRVELLASLPAVQMQDYPHLTDESTRFRSITLTWVSGAQGVLDLARAHQRARSMLGLTEPVYELPGHCQARGCGRPQLRVKAGEDAVWCDHCGSVMTRDDYDRIQNVFLRIVEAA